VKRNIAVPAAAMVLILVVTGAAFAHSDKAHPKKAQPAGTAEEKPFGRAGDPGRVDRTLKLDMRDEMRFIPAALNVQQGETIRFVVHNSGKIMHELVIGTMQDLNEHAELMKKFPDMEHDEPYMAHVKPGETEEIVWQFSRAGEFHYACLIAGHFEAGMIGRIEVAGPGAKIAPAPDAAAAPMAEGQIRKIDKAAGKMTIKHGELKNLGMPPMTMVFRVKHPALLDKVQVGDSVRFNAEKIGGQYTVTDIEPK
jgi:uncharacterized cupredoxin-like copper-binding protein/Cu/Ag efflux protein CusF